MGIELFISEITVFFLDYPVYFYYVPPICYTNTISNQITGIIGHIQNHFITTSPLTYVTNGIQDFQNMLYQKLGGPRTSTRQLAIWWTTICML